MASEGKRKQEGGDDARSESRKKQKTNKKRWQGPRKKAQGGQIEVGDAGIWATCERGREPKCVAELRDLFHDFAETFYADELEREEAASNETAQGKDTDIKDDEDENEDGGVDDIEAQIQSEVAAIRNPTTAPLFTNVHIDMQCVIFFKTRAPVQPVQLVHALCKDLSQSHERKTRFAKRLTPTTCMARATDEGLEELSKKVLAPHFHTSGSEVKKFAIRPTLRNHGGQLTRNFVIQRVAGLVGAPHRVDLGEPDFVILVDVYKAHCGMSVVPGDFETLKRYNLAEIYEPSGGGQQQQESQASQTQDVEQKANEKEIVNTEQG